MSFFSLAKTLRSGIRHGTLHLAHGDVPTPAFMPIGTYGAVKGIDVTDLTHAGADIILSNTYHLYFRPGAPILASHKGLHSFMGWQKPLLTDSGGYQVFSLSAHRKISEKGVEFRDPLSGQRVVFTPEKVIDMQRTIGSDIMMVLDECPAYPSTKRDMEASMALTTTWALRALAHKQKKHLTRHALFAIVQGGVYADLRKKHAKELARLPFDGFAVGGFAVGEPEQKMFTALAHTLPFLPTHKPRYMMGVGYPHQIVQAARMGIDMFDCVLPTRNARHGSLFVWKKKILTGKDFYGTLRIKNAAFARDTRPIDPTCTCATCKVYSRSYIRHLFMIHEQLAMRLSTIHNVHFYLELMRRIRSNSR